VEAPITTAAGGKSRLIAWLCAGLVLALAAATAAAGLALRSGRQGRLAALEVTSTPPGGEVRLDGRFAGMTPLLIRGVAAGEHVVEVSLAGSPPEAVRVTAPAGGTLPVSVKLAPPTVGALVVESEPPGAEVILDGQSRGCAPLRLEGLGAGRHRVLLQRSRFDPWRADVEVRAGEDCRVSARLEDHVRRFMEAAVAEKPRDLTARADLLHYLVVVRDWPAAADCFAAGLLLAGAADAPEGTEYFALYYLKDRGALTEELAAAYAARVCDRLAKSAGQDPQAVARGLDFLLAVVQRGRARDPDRLRAVRELVVETALRAAGQLPLLEPALDAAFRERSAEQVRKLLAATTAARPGDGVHLGQAAMAVVNRSRAADVESGLRGEALAAVAEAVEKFVAAGGAGNDRVLAARLYRLLGRVHQAAGSAEKALAQQDRALAALAAAGGAHPGMLWPWKLERAGLLLELKRGEEARKELSAVAETSPEGPWRKEAREELAKLPPPATGP
jgi:tetratricopeptide (TPR) repeat protein